MNNIATILQENVVKKDLDMPLKRVELLTAIQRVLDLALEKIDNRYTKNKERIKWSRIIVQAVSSGNRVLRDQDLEELANRVKILEETGAK